MNYLFAFRALISILAKPQISYYHIPCLQAEISGFLIHEKSIVGLLQ
jgi:hypothetical protein